MLTSAYVPLSAVLVQEELYQTIAGESGKRGGFGHGFTYSAHPVAAAVAREVLAIYAERDIVGGVAAKAGQFRARIAALGQNEMVREGRSIGLLGGLEMRSAPDALKLQMAAQREGLFVRAVGGDTVAICPPLTISAAEIDVLFDRLANAMRAL